MNKKIVHIIIGLHIGGAELMLKRLILQSQIKGVFKHEIISLTDLGIIGHDLKAEGVSIHTLGMTSGLSIIKIFFNLRNLLIKLNPDVVQTWMYHSDLIGGLAAKSLGIKNIIWGIRNSAIDSNSSKSKKIIRKLCANLSYSIPSTIICVAHKAKDVHVEIGYDEKKMYVIPNGFDLDRFYPDKNKRNKLRSSLMLNEKDLVIGNIGRFAPAKNQINFLKACIFLLDEGFNFKILLGGRDVDLDNSEISSLFLNNQYADHFIFLGEVADTPSFYNAIDIFCLCSYTEGFPNVLGEAMATEKICLTTDAGDAKLILGNFGFHIVSTSYIDIAKALETNILNGCESKLKNLGQQARIAIEDKYSLTKIVQKFEQLYAL